MIKDSVIKELEKILGQGLITEDTELSGYAVDGAVPQILAVPGSVEEVAEVIKIAAENSLAVVVRGGGTKMGLGNSPQRLDLVLSTQRLDAITDMDTANLTVTVQAGVWFSGLQDALSGQENRCYLPVSSSGPQEGEICSEREHMGCFVPLDPPLAKRATFGGIVAANSSGPRRLLHGTVRDMLLGVRYVDARGRIIGMGGKTVKNVSGYDVSKLMIGSMGTLGVICEMTLRLLPLPETASTMVAGFRAMDEAFELVDKIMSSKLTPAAIEVFDSKVEEKIGVGLQETAQGSRFFVAVLAEGAAEAVRRICSDTAQMAKDAGAQGSMLVGEEGQFRFWAEYGELCNPERWGEPPPVLIRLSCPISRLMGLLSSASQEADSLNLEAGIFAHAGSGVGRVILQSRNDRADFQAGIFKWTGRMLEKCLEVGGNLVVEGADYPWKGELPLWGISRPDFDILKRIKREVDPEGIFSPGRFVAGI